MTRSDAIQALPVRVAGVEGRSNNFSILRLLFATLVILSHSFELIDGNRSREILTRVFGTISFGVLAVDGFFVISGYLITKSYLTSPGAGNYLLKRVLRIYPGFIAAFGFSFAAAAYFAHHALTTKEIVNNFFDLVCLSEPRVLHAYAGSHDPDANGAIWTISYEFGCYLMIMLLGAAGLLKRASLIFFATYILTILFCFIPEIHFPIVANHAVATAPVGTDPNPLSALQIELIRTALRDIRFASIFLVGSCFYLFRQYVVYTKTIALFAAIVLVAALFSNNLCQPALAVLGGYLILWFAEGIREFSLSAVLNKTDLSYGIYLYAWPVQKIILAVSNGVTPPALFIETFMICVVLSYVSWTLVEKPALTMKRRISMSRAIRGNDANLVGTVIVENN